MGGRADRIELTYVLPLRWQSADGVAELGRYLRRLAGEVDELIVVDASPGPVFKALEAALPPRAKHHRPDPRHRFLMAKVDGVTTGVLAASNEKVVLADDDVRYRRAQLQRAAALLDRCELVRPQNYFDPLPWHARLDSGRMLVNRAFTGDRQFPVGDFPGTLAIRRSAFAAIGGYDGDVIFENLELMRSLRAAGGRVVSPLDLYVRRLPPSTSHFLSQRVRQAYDDFAIPGRMALWLGLAPALVAARRRPRRVATAAAAVAGAAELGRRRADGRRFFPASGSLLAPLWVLERSVCAWAALAQRLRGGVRYRGARIPRAATRFSVLERRLGGRLADPGRLEADRLVGAVAERPHPRAPTAAEGDRSPV
jgi:hypothetical protein